MRTTRRNVLKGGGKAVAAVATLPFLFSTNPAQAQEDAELFALYDECRRLETEYIDAINRHDDVWLPIRQQFPKYLDGVKPEGLAEAEARAGLPALEKKQRAAERAWLDALDRFYDIPALTPAGMILKFTVEWGKCSRRNWRAKDYAHVEFPENGMASILMDLERLSGRRI